MGIKGNIIAPRTTLTIQVEFVINAGVLIIYNKRRKKMEDQMMPRALSAGQTPTTTKRLEGEKERLEQRLALINDALDKLNRNPEVAELVDAISRV